MSILGKVTSELDVARGPDVEMSVSVPVEWLGRTIQIDMPRNLHCAACSGGGCDACERSGAVSLRARDAETEPLEIVLPAGDESPSGVKIRIPEQGGASSDPGLGRGHLLLTIEFAQAPSEGVRLTGQGRSQERAELMKRSLFMAAVLVVLFVGMLRLSGWL